MALLTMAFHIHIAFWVRVASFSPLCDHATCRTLDSVIFSRLYFLDCGIIGSLDGGLFNEASVGGW